MRTARLSPVAWTEGMFLRPQHLQHHELVAEERLAYHLKQINPFHWGVRELKLNEDALSDNRIEVLRLDAVLPGGLLVQYPGNAHLEPRTFEPGDDPFDVWVGVRALSQTNPNGVPDHEDNKDTRYVFKSEQIPDLNTGGSEVPVDLSEARVRLFVSGEERDLEVYEALKIARINPTGDGRDTFEVSGAYCPPLLAIQANQALYERVAEYSSRVAAKVRSLAGRTSTGHVEDLKTMFTTYTFARMAPLLRHHLSTGCTHPYHMYSTLVEMAGALAAFTMDEAAQLPQYDHDDIGTCFARLLDFLDEKIGETAKDRSKAFELVHDAASNMYTTKELTADLADPSHSFFLGLKANLEDEELKRRVEDEGKAGAISSVRIAMKTNLQTLPLKALAVAPTEIRARAGYQYFSVDSKSSKWSKVRDDCNFALHLPKIDGIEARLYVVTQGDG